MSSDAWFGAQSGRLGRRAQRCRKGRWLLQKGMLSGGFKTMPVCPRTSLPVTVSRSCCCRRI